MVRQSTRSVLHGFQAVKYWMRQAARQNYSVSFARQLLGTSKKAIGYMFFDLDVDYVTEPLSDIDMGSKSIIGLIAPDGGENRMYLIIWIFRMDSSILRIRKFFTKLADSEDVSGSSYQFLNDVFAAMKMDVVMDIAYDEVEKHLDIDLKGDEMGILIGKRGQTLDSLQYLVSLVVNKDSEDYIRVKVDTEDYRKRRKETLENLAKNIAYKVKRSRRPVALEPMNPYERRIIHSALQNDKYVTTHSEGEEPYRHVVVTLKKNGER